MKTRGAAILFAVAITGITLIALLALVTLLVGQLRIATDIKESAIAVAAADAAIERALFQIRRMGVTGTIDPPDCDSTTGFTLPTTGARACYIYDVPDTPGLPPDCVDATIGCIQGFGEYRGVQRAFQVGF